MASVNNDGDLPLDFAEEEEREDMINFLKKEIEKKGSFISCIMIISGNIGS